MLFMRRHTKADTVIRQSKAPFAQYNLLSNRMSNRLTTGCIVHTNIQPVVKPVCIVYTARCQTGCTTRFGNRLNAQWLFVINTNLPRILHRFQDIVFDRSNIAIFFYPSCVQLPRRRGSPGTISVKIFCGCQWMAKVPNAV